MESQEIDISKTKDPLILFNSWRDEALNDGNNSLVDAMTLSTVDLDGNPSSRALLLRGMDSEGFKFYTDSRSPKALHIKQNPNVSLLFVWTFKVSENESGYRQVRIQGPASFLPKEETEKYFHSEPQMAKIRAIVLSQSSRVEDMRKSVLEKAETLLKEDPLSLKAPETYQGYLVTPITMEFYQGSRNALNDRIRFLKNSEGEVEKGQFKGENGWIYEQLEA